jgi:hypothetical protein
VKKGGFGFSAKRPKGNEKGTIFMGEYRGMK